MAQSDDVRVTVNYHTQEPIAMPPAALPSPSASALYREPHKVAAVYAAFILFGLGSWIMSNCVFVEIAALYQRTPEKAAISAYLIVAIQASNIFPTLYMMFNNEQQLVSIRTAIWALLAMGIVVCVLLSIFWDQTSVIFGHSHSTALLILVFFGGMVSSTTSVVYYPFVATFPPLFTSALSTGEGLSGVIAGVLGIVQDPGASHMNITIGGFFFYGAIVFFVALLAFVFLTKSSWATEIHSSMYREDSGDFDYKFTPPLKRAPPSPARKMSETLPLVLPQSKHQFSSSVERRNYVLTKLWKPLSCQVILCAMSFGVIPSILPFLGSKYADSAEVLKWSSVLSMACDPLARFLTSFYRWYNVTALTSLTVLLGAGMVVSSTSAHPLFSAHPLGGIAPVAANCTFVFLFAYSQTMAYLTLKREVRYNETYATTAYQWSGYLAQMGGLLGTVIIFPLVTYTSLFQGSYGSV
ncbi:hypothetical protein ACHHYP_10014 [Achlya hypogyna]|uniref:Equilibrative Nucleoside Transporter (ENT) Family n=1 Tax=Achlya hypogyna TaxID=1202772 RepID=A0A1V9ZIY7_ACHHY|nr:hypothetical protein ACHHYP_10014 [Achlya hypogyna]